MTSAVSFGNQNTGVQLSENHGNLTIQLHPRDDRNRIEQAKGGLLKDSFRWILSNEGFKQWQNTQNNRLLWIRGDPGKGKTMLLCGIIEELTNSVDEGSNISFFFCQASDARINSATAVLRGLIYLLVEKQPSLISHVRSRYDKTGKALFEDKNAFYAVSEIFTRILKDPTLKTTYFIVDALDECMTDLTLLLALITRDSSSPSQVKWIISSRNWLEIEEQLETTDQTSPISLELNETSVSEAVEIFIRHKVEKLSKMKKYTQEIQSTVSDYLSLNSQGTFLWVALVCSELAKISRLITLKRLEAFPPGLNDLYDRMMDHIRYSDSVDAEICLRVLSIVSTLYRPPTLHELKGFLEEEDNEYDSEDVSEIIARCGSFLTTREDVVRFVHHLGINSVRWSKDGRKLASASDDLTIKIWDIATGSCIFTLEGHTKAVKLVAWSPAKTERLASASNDYTVRIWDAIKGQCIFCLCDDEIPISITGPPITAIAWSPDGNTFAIALGRTIEAWKFSTDHSEFLFGLEGYASDVYSISWSKDGRRLASATAHGTIVIWDMWHQDPFFSIIGGHSLAATSVAWSQDGTRLASSSEDVTIKIWDPDTSHDLSIIPTPTDLIRSMAWSPGGKMLALASENKTIKIWDSTTGEWIFNFEENDIEPYSITWSPDGSQLSLASYDKSLRVWDMDTGKCKLAMGGNEPPRVISHAWSPDGKKLVFGSTDGTVHIRDLNIGTSIHMLQDWQRDDVILVDWSPDGSQLASKLDNETIRVWDLETSQCRITLRDAEHVEGYDASDKIAWSTEQNLLAWCHVEGSDSTTRVWDLTTGKMIYMCHQPTPRTHSFLSFDDKTPNHLHTSWGLLDISCADLNTTSHRISAYSSGPCGYNLSEDGVWITYKGTNILWLPPEYRSDARSVAAISGTNIAINCPSHRIMIIQFAEQNPIVPP
ncbi:NACHT nucleoside triphosphatase [Penicillium manginii]|uniref:NACHT nucleoside triphosphatase n=1 Tax=Penicillium manginii TaxID=203109 RepID=UPI002549AED3|nr:NACHT nucleoside triphosphatase [Penicillium manginii]KAJ5750760.1 NACHT nucleoside triphosphatase [Penicillium manginii]